MKSNAMFLKMIRDVCDDNKLDLDAKKELLTEIFEDIRECGRKQAKESFKESLIKLHSLISTL